MPGRQPVLPMLLRWKLCRGSLHRLRKVVLVQHKEFRSRVSLDASRITPCTGTILTRLRACQSIPPQSAWAKEFPHAKGASPSVAQQSEFSRLFRMKLELIAVLAFRPCVASSLSFAKWSLATGGDLTANSWIHANCDADEISATNAHVQSNVHATAATVQSTVSTTA